MAKSRNKSQAARIEVIDKLLSSGRQPYTWVQLQTACTDKLIEEGYEHREDALVSERTIKEDILFMNKKYGEKADPTLAYDPEGNVNERLVINKRKKKGNNIKIEDTFYVEENYKYGYEYHPKAIENGFSIFESNITTQDLLYLKNLLNAIKIFDGLPIFSDQSEEITKIEKKLQRKNSKKQEPYIFFDHEEAVGVEWINNIAAFLEDKNEIEIKYVSLKGKKDIYHLKPYFLKQWNQMWYLIAYSKENNKVRHFNLSRIMHVEKTNEKIIAPKAVTHNSYYTNVWGIEPNNGKVLHIFLEVETLRAQLLLDKYPDKLLLEEEKGKVTIISLYAVKNKEVINFILSLGKDAKVLKPATIVNSVKKTLSTAAQQYE